MPHCFKKIVHNIAMISIVIKCHKITIQQHDGMYNKIGEGREGEELAMQ